MTSKTVRIFQSRLNPKMTCVKAVDPADQSRVNTILGCHPYGYTKQTGDMVGLYCPDSRADLIASLARAGFTEA